MTDNLEAVEGRYLAQLRVRGNLLSILHPPTLDASNMVMMLGDPVETGFRPSNLELSDEPILRKKIQIPVDRAQADPRESLAHTLIHAHRGGMCTGGAQLLKNDLTLFGVPLDLHWRHDSIFSSNKYHYC